MVGMRPCAQVAVARTGEIGGGQSAAGGNLIRAACGNQTSSLRPRFSAGRRMFRRDADPGLRPIAVVPPG